MMASVADLGWAAALLEGEGCVSWNKRPPWPSGRKRRSTLRVTIGNNEVVLLERFQGIFGLGTIRPKGDHHYRFRAASRQAQTILEQLLPYMTEGCQKRVKAEAAIAEMRCRPRWKQGVTE